MKRIHITEQDINRIVAQTITSVLNENSSFMRALRLAKKGIKGGRQHGYFQNKWGGSMHGMERNHKSLRSDIADWLKNPELDCAQIAKQLWPHKNEDSRRSYFYKCRDNKTYKAHGKMRRYDFTNREYQKLYSIMKSSALTE